jgi:hypothetical protein
MLSTRARFRSPSLVALLSPFWTSLDHCMGIEMGIEMGCGEMLFLGRKELESETDRSEE